MEKKTEDLLGSRIGAALTACGSKVEFSGCINFILLDYTKEENKQLIMDNHGTLNANCHE